MEPKPKPSFPDAVSDILSSTFFESGMASTLNQKLAKLQTLINTKDDIIISKDKEIQQLKSDVCRLEVENSVYKEKLEDSSQTG
jgi:hypothetical protein